MTVSCLDGALTGAFVPARGPAVRAVEVETEAILVDDRVDGLHLLNAQAALVWACFDGSSTLAAIAADLADALDVPFERVLFDVIAVTRDLVAQGLVIDGRDPAPPEAALVTREPEPTRVDDSPAPLVLEEPPNP